MDLSTEDVDEIRAQQESPVLQDNQIMQDSEQVLTIEATFSQTVKEAVQRSTYFFRKEKKYIKILPDASSWNQIHLILLKNHDHCSRKDLEVFVAFRTVNNINARIVQISPQALKTTKGYDQQGLEISDIRRQ